MFKVFMVFQSKGDQKLWYSLWCLWCLGHPSRSSRSRRSEGHRVRSCLNWSYWRSGLNNLCCSKTKASLISTQPNPPVCEHLQHCCNISNAGILFCSNSASTPKSLAKQSCAKSPQRCPCALPAWRCARQSVAINHLAWPVHACAYRKPFSKLQNAKQSPETETMKLSCLPVHPSTWEIYKSLL